MTPKAMDAVAPTTKDLLAQPDTMKRSLRVIAAEDEVRMIFAICSEILLPPIGIFLRTILQ